MTVFYERCPCGAEFRVEDNNPEMATARLEKWREVHKHEVPKRVGDATTSGEHVGFDAGHYGRIEEVL